MTMQEKLDLVDQYVNDPEMIKQYPNLNNREAASLSIVVRSLGFLEDADLRRTYAGKKKFKYRHPNTNEVFYYTKRSVYKKDGVTLVPEYEFEDD